tara:strand:- start:377 stop:754 length:378 start_codon:yes stop_codon:yes gene_type:complete
MNLIKKVALSLLCLISINAFADTNYDKRELVRSINNSITEIEVLSNKPSSENCLWHVRESNVHMKSARTAVFNDDVLSVKSHTLTADKSINDLEYEGPECRRLLNESKKASYLIQEVLHNLRNAT